MSRAADAYYYRAAIAPFDRQCRRSRTQVRTAMRGLAAKLLGALTADVDPASLVNALPVLLPDELIRTMLNAVYLRAGLAAAEAFDELPVAGKSARAVMQTKRIAPQPDRFASLRLRLQSLTRDLLGNTRVQQVANRTRGLVADVLAQAKTVTDRLRREVRKVLLRPARLNLLARTETLWAWSVGQTWAAVAVGRTTKRWLPVLDGNTRDAHAAMSRKPAVLISDTFLVGGEQLRYPGDPAGSASNIVNCRCTLIYE